MIDSDMPLPRTRRHFRVGRESAGDGTLLINFEVVVDRYSGASFLS
jgi:hypothetical protein